AERLLAALLMGFSLGAMHHAAMASGRFIPDDIWREHFYRGGHVHLLPEAWLEPWVAGASLLAVLGLAIAATVSRWRHVRHTARPAPDRLTGLPNGALLRDAIAARLAAGRGCAVIAVRVERYDGLGQRLGRREAEQMLVRVGLRLRAAVRPTDVAARLGGADYGVLVDDPDAALMVPDRVRHRLERPVKPGPPQALRPRPPVLDRGPELRPRLPCARFRRPAAGRRPPARRDGVADRRPPARPPSPAVGALPHPRAPGWARRRAHQDPPRRGRRRLG